MMIDTVDWSPHFNAVMEFMLASEQEPSVRLQYQLIVEEWAEVAEYMDKAIYRGVAPDVEDITGILKEIIDTMYVLFGFHIAVEYEGGTGALTDEEVEELQSIIAGFGVLFSGMFARIPEDDFWASCFAEVHRSNMSKVEDGLRNEDGKIIKGPSYERANLSDLGQYAYDTIFGDEDNKSQWIFSQL